MKQAGLFAGGILTLAMALAAGFAIAARHLGLRRSAGDVIDALGVFGRLIQVFYDLHLQLTGFLQSFTIVIEVLLFLIWLLAATRLLRMALGR